MGQFAVVLLNFSENIVNIPGDIRLPDDKESILQNYHTLSPSLQGYEGRVYFYKE